MSPDTHVSLTTIFSLPKGKTAKDYIDKLYARAKVAKRSIYYGFATNENKLMCREGYDNAEEFLLYMKEIVSYQLGDEVTILVSGPGLELDKIKPKLTASLQAEITFAELNNDNMLLGRLPESTTDTHVTVLPEITVPQGRMTEFKSVMEKFCTAAKNGTTTNLPKVRYKNNAKHYVSVVVVLLLIYCFSVHPRLSPLQSSRSL